MGKKWPTLTCVYQEEGEERPGSLKINVYIMQGVSELTRNLSFADSRLESKKNSLTKAEKVSFMLHTMAENGNN